MAAFAVIAHGASWTNHALARAATRLGHLGRVLTPEAALVSLADGDTALARLDVRASVDGVEDGLWELRVLERRGVRVLNPPVALGAAHDKLETAARLCAAGVPHPQTELVRGLPSLEPPLVLKPRFGSWGRGVVRCADEHAVLCELARRRPYELLAQELVEPVGEDLRVLVAGGVVVGAVRRLAAPGEWRTNVALGASRIPTEAPPAARAIALAAAAACGADLVGVDLLPAPDRGWVALEVNGAVDFTPAYSRSEDVFAAVVAALTDVASAACTGTSTRSSSTLRASSSSAGSPSPG
jgi:RimK family alpha-L-glutamate ligase